MLSIGTDMDTVFPDWPSGRFGEIASEIRDVLLSETPCGQDVLTGWLSELSSFDGRRMVLEKSLALLASGDVARATETLASLLSSERDFVILSVQVLTGLEDPLRIPATARSRLRENLRRILEKELV